MRQLMGINGENFLEHGTREMFRINETMRDSDLSPVPCPHGSNAGKQVAFTHKGDDLTKI